MSGRVKGEACEIWLQYGRCSHYGRVRPGDAPPAIAGRPPRLIEVAFTPQTADQDGDFAQAVLPEGQYEIISS
jgi:hypothetical protein